MNTNLTAKEITEKVKAALESNEELLKLQAELSARTQRYNEVCFDGAELTEDEVKAEITVATLLAKVDEACEKLNHKVKRTVYETLFAIRQDALPAILLGAIPQYAHKDETRTVEDTETKTHAISVKPAALSIKNYDAWAMREHQVHIVADVSYFAKADTLAYYMIERVALELGIDSLTNYRFVYGFTDAITKAKISGTKASKTTICGELQKCVDALLFEARDDGKNTYKAISRDVTYLQNVVLSAGKERLTLKSMKASQFLSKVEDVMFRIVSDKAYTISHPVEKSKK